MNRTTLVVALIGLSMAAAVSAQTPRAASPTPVRPKSTVALDPKEAAAGEVIYLRYCAACHGRSLKGDGALASGLVSPPPDLTAMARMNGGTFAYDQMASTIDGRKTVRMHGTPDMPVWGEIFAVTSGTESPSAESAVRRITLYVWSKQTKPGSAPEKK